MIDALIRLSTVSVVVNSIEDVHITCKLRKEISMFGFHAPELIIILVVALLIFGPKRLPEMGSSIGKSIKEFRKGMSEITNPKEEKKEDNQPDTDNLPDLEAVKREIASKK